MRRAGLVSVLFMFSLFMSGEKIAEFSSIYNPGWMSVKDGKLYVLDNCTVKVFNCSTGALVRAFCSEGEGPGEIKANSEMQPQVLWDNGNLFIYGNHKFVRYSTKGKLLGEKTVKFSAVQVVPVGKNYVVVYWYSRNDNERGYKAVLCSSGFKVLKTLYRNNIPRVKYSTAGVKIPEFVVAFSSDKKIYIIDYHSSDFAIETFDLDGNSCNVIKNAYKAQKVDEEVKNEIYDWYRINDRFKGYGLTLANLKKRIRYPEYMPVLRNLKFNGKQLIAQTYRVINNSTEFMIMGENGTFKKRVLPWSETDLVQFGSNSTFCFDGDNYYYLVDNTEDETWELHAVKY